MNYLAHAYLSFDDEEILFGNFIGDFIKGTKNMGLPDNVWKGVKLHRAIDSFTDQHPATIQAKDLIRKDLGHASGIFVDMIFDHILAVNWANYSNKSLKEFTSEVYLRLDRYESYFPEQFAEMFSYMKTGDWLANYDEERCMNRFLAGLSRRLKVENNLAGSYKFYKENRKEMDANFYPLFADLTQLAKNY